MNWTFKSFKPTLAPRGGKHFVDADGVVFRGLQWEHVAAQLKSYRKRAGQPPGNPEQEIANQACARHPEYCRETNAPAPRPSPIVAEQQATGDLNRRVGRWMISMLRLKKTGALRTVSSEEASRRALICAACPAQKVFLGSCGSCKAIRKAAIDAILAGKRVNSRLQGCRILGEDTRISTGVEITHSDDAALPAQCWRRNS